MPKQTELRPVFIGEPNWMTLATRLHEIEAAKRGAVIVPGSVSVTLRDGRVLGKGGTDQAV